VQDDRLTVELNRTPGDAHSALESVPDAMVIVNAPDEIQLADAESAILVGSTDKGPGRAPVEVLVADRYLDRHPGLRMGFFSESRTDPDDSLERSVMSQNTGATSFVHKLVEFRQCCDVLRTMRVLWLRTHQPPPSHV
jgi:hypothetical protein